MIFFALCGVLAPLVTLIAPDLFLPVVVLSIGCWTLLFPFVLSELLIERDRFGIVCAFYPFWFLLNPCSAIALLGLMLNTVELGRAMAACRKVSTIQQLGCGGANHRLQITDISHIK